MLPPLGAVLQREREKPVQHEGVLVLGPPLDFGAPRLAEGVRDRSGLEAHDAEDLPDLGRQFPRKDHLARDGAGLGHAATPRRR